MRSEHLVFPSLFILLAALPTSASAQPSEWDGAYDLVGPIRTDLSYSEQLIDRQDYVTNKMGVALRARESGLLEPQSLYLGGRVLATQIWEHTNTAGKFPILSRLPPTHTSGTSDSYGVINEATLNATATLPWITAFVQGEYTEVEYPGQDDVQLRKYWVVFGDLTRSPFYVGAGRKTVNFGNFATYAPFTHSHSSHYFWSQTDDPLIEFGYLTDQTELALSLIPEHRGLRVISSPKNDSDLSNFALNASHRFDFENGTGLTIGAGYLRGTIYDSTIAHHPPGVGIDRFWNGAYNVNITFSGENFDLMAEYTETEERWPATNHKVSSTTIQGRYRTDTLGRPSVYSLSASRGVQGDGGTEWEKMDQVILGLEIELAPHVKIGAEYMYNYGFVPLILPRFTGDRDVESHTFIVGLELTF
jgi:opacity protein-like surface antigen